MSALSISVVMVSRICMFDWMINTPWFWSCLVIAILFSIFWGIYGCKETGENIEVEKKGKKMYLTKRIGIFLSESIGSLMGWACLYTLIVRLRTSNLTIGSFDVFLGIIAVLGITGYSS